MADKLSLHEIKKIIQKLNDQYDEYAGKHGRAFFNKEFFKARYMEALKSGADLESFAYAEVKFFDDLKKKLEMIEEESRIRTEKPFTRRVEQYIEELEKKWRKYPALFSDTDISDEAQHFSGALLDFYQESWLLINPALKRMEATVQREYRSLTEELEHFVLCTLNKLPYEIELYLLNTRRFGIEKANMVFLKTSAGLLKKIRHFLARLKKRMESSETPPVQSPGSEGMAENDHRQEITGGLDKLENIIRDFRFHHLV